MNLTMSCVLEGKKERVIITYLETKESIRSFKGSNELGRGVTFNIKLPNIKKHYWIKKLKSL